MTDFAQLVEALVAHRPVSELALAPPATDAAWERCDLIYTDVELPEEVRQLYDVANGFETGWVEPIGGRWAPLPIEPPMWGISWIAPCRPEAQLPIMEYSRAWLTLLLEGDHKGEVWVARRSDPDLLGTLQESLTR